MNTKFSLLIYKKAIGYVVLNAIHTYEVSKSIYSMSFNRKIKTLLY